MKRSLILSLLAALALFACTPDGDGEDDLDAGTNNEEGQTCDPGPCDAISVPAVIITLQNAQGEPYCEDGVDIRWWEKGDESTARTAVCSCAGGRVDAGTADTGGEDAGNTSGLNDCYINNEPGETIMVELTTSGFEPMQQEVSLPCECHPTESITFTLPE